MNRWILFIIVSIWGLNAQAHQTDLSSTMLIEQADNQWSLVVRASLSAFEQEIKTNFGEATYQSPEEFQALIIKHLQNSLSIVINQKDTLALQNAIVKLGHETNVVFEVAGLTQAIQSLSVQNTSFQDIHRNQSALIIIKKGFAKQQFILNEHNQHKASLLATDKQFVLSSQPDTEGWSWYQKGIAGLFIIGFSLLTFHFYKSQKQEKRRSPKDAPLPYTNTIIRNLH